MRNAQYLFFAVFSVAVAVVHGVQGQATGPGQWLNGWLEGLGISAGSDGVYSSNATHALPAGVARIQAFSLSGLPPKPKLLCNMSWVASTMGTELDLSAAYGQQAFFRLLAGRE